MSTLEDFLNSMITSVSNSTMQSVGSNVNIGPCNDIRECRTLPDIFKSCYSVIIISIWVSIHPNVPSVHWVGKSTLGNLLNEVIVMTIAIIAPELIMLWAMRQRYKAMDVAKKFKKYGWTKTHGFLAIMKGIALYDGEKFCCYVEDKPIKPEHQVHIEKIETILEQNRRLLQGDDGARGAQVPGNSNIHRSMGELGETHRVEIGGGTSQSSTHVLTSLSTEGLGSKDPTPSRTHRTETIGLDDQTLSKVDTSLLQAGISGHGSVRDVPYNASGSSSTLDQMPSSCSIVDFEKYDSRPVSRQALRAPTNLTLLEYLLDNGLLRIHASEIKGNFDHGDVFSKIIAVLQITWFLSKLIGRKVGGLFITELEIVTLGCAFLSLVAYGCWWDKPQRVRYPYKVLIPKLASEPITSTEKVREAKTMRESLSSEYHRIMDRVRGDYQHIRRVNPKLPTALFIPLYLLYFFGEQIGALLNADKAEAILKVPDYLFS
ncbi:hypothetical protein V5O48_018587, partial [Marasmius crinis-equi]